MFNFLSKSKIEELVSRKDINECLKNNKLVIIDFFSNNCSHCKTQEKVFNQFLDFYGNVKIVKVNCSVMDENFLKEYGVFAFPTLVFYANGTEYHRLIGLNGHQKIKEIADKSEFANSL